MTRSRDRILTTHVGSLPRPNTLLDLLLAQDRGEVVDTAEFDVASRDAIEEVVKKQTDLGIDIVSDGEMSKISYTYYVKHRLSGISSDIDSADDPKPNKLPQDLADFPEALASRQKRTTGAAAMRSTYCVGPVAYANAAPLQQDLTTFSLAIAKAKPFHGFLTAASPGVLANFIIDLHYHNEDKFVADLADAMRAEYEAIAGAGFILQIDCPDLAMARHFKYQDVSDSDFLKIVERNVEAINHATSAIAPEMLRMHICWGNYSGPHTRDIPVANILTTIMKCRPQAISFEAANPRHEHEWEDWQAVRLPDDKILIPGVIDSTTNFVEHPRLVAQRIARFVDVVGPDRVIAGSDCGFGSFAGRDYVFASVAWAKLGALVEGARLASQDLTKKTSTSRSRSSAATKA